MVTSQLDPNEQSIKELLDKTMSDDISEELDERMERAFGSFREKLSEHPYYQSTSSFRRFQWFYGWNLTWSTGVAFLVLIFISISLLTNQSPTWADVAQQFKSISFFHATFNIRKVDSPQAIQFEFWMGNGGKFRLQYGPQVVFANQAGITNAFDASTRQSVEPPDFLKDVVNHINSADHFSLETVLNSFTGNVSDLRPVPNRVEEVSNDISIFDLQLENTNETIRIWALRESMLPIYLKFANLENGISYNTFFSYQQEQPDTFFDAKSYEDSLSPVTM